MNSPQPQLSIITTPNPESKHAPSTPSPQAVDEFESSMVTSANRSAVVSRMLSDHLVTVNDDEVIVSSSTVTLPELESDESPSMTRPLDDDASASFSSPRFFYRITPHNSPMLKLSKHTPPTPIQRKMLYQSVSAIASPIRIEDYMPQLHVGPEREVLFHTDSLGIKISRHTDGYVRVLSVTPYRSLRGSTEKVREGEIYEGDVVREVSDVNLRMPIDSAVWKLTVGLIKMAPRPLKFVVAKELEMESEEEEEADVGNVPSAKAFQYPNQPNRMPPQEQQKQQPTSIARSSSMDSKFGPTRVIKFYETALGVKLHHNKEGYVQILSVTPYKSFPGSPKARTGDMKEGDIVIEVGGMFNLREPIDDTLWGALVMFIRETRRPLTMIVADADCLRPESVKEEEEEEEEEEAKNQGEMLKNDESKNNSDEVDDNANGEEEDSSSESELPDDAKSI